MSEPIRVTPEMLVWARETVGLSNVEEAVGLIARKHITSEALRTWESGKKYPTYSQLERLARIYKRPIALFFFPYPPEETTPAQSFRSLNDRVIGTLSYRMRLLLRKAQSLQLSFMELAGKQSPAKKSVLKQVTLGDASMEDCVHFVRDYLGVSLEDQMKWKSMDMALKQWRKSFEKCGVFVFKDSFKDDDIAGFCLHSEEFPIIYVNNGMSKSRQIFTLFHELAHLLLQTGGVDFRRNDHLDQLDAKRRKVEVMCNKFAGKFLVPDKDFEQQAVGTGDIGDEQIEQFADRYRVSREVMLYKFYDLNRIDQQSYERKVDKLRPQFSQKKRKGGGNYYLTKNTHLSETFTSLAFRRYYNKEITIDQMSDYLGVNAKNFASFETQFLRSTGKLL